MSRLPTISAPAGQAQDILPRANEERAPYLGEFRPRGSDLGLGALASGLSSLSVAIARRDEAAADTAKAIRLNDFQTNAIATAADAVAKARDAEPEMSLKVFEDTFKPALDAAEAEADPELKSRLRLVGQRVYLQSREETQNSATARLGEKSRASIDRLGDMLVPMLAKGVSPEGAVLTFEEAVRSSPHALRADQQEAVIGAYSSRVYSQAAGNTLQQVEDGILGAKEAMSRLDAWEADGKLPRGTASSLRSAMLTKERQAEAAHAKAAESAASQIGALVLGRQFPQMPPPEDATRFVLDQAASVADPAERVAMMSRVAKPIVEAALAAGDEKAYAWIKTLHHEVGLDADAAKLYAEHDKRFDVAAIQRGVDSGNADMLAKAIAKGESPWSIRPLLNGPATPEAMDMLAADAMASGISRSQFVHWAAAGSLPMAPSVARQLESGLADPATEGFRHSVRDIQLLRSAGPVQFDMFAEGTKRQTVTRLIGKLPIGPDSFAKAAMIADPRNAKAIDYAYTASTGLFDDGTDDPPSYQGVHVLATETGSTIPRGMLDEYDAELALQVIQGLESASPSSKEEASALVERASEAAKSSVSQRYPEVRVPNFRQSWMPNRDGFVHVDPELLGIHGPAEREELARFVQSYGSWKQGETPASAMGHVASWIFDTEVPRPDRAFALNRDFVASDGATSLDVAIPVMGHDGTVAAFMLWQAGTATGGRTVYPTESRYFNDVHSRFLSSFAGDDADAGVAANRAMDGDAGLYISDLSPDRQRRFEAEFATRVDPSRPAADREAFLDAMAAVSGYAGYRKPSNK